MNNHPHNNSAMLRWLLPGFLIMVIGLSAVAQQPYSLAQVLDNIHANNPVEKMFDADIRSMDAAAKGARSWMPPEIGAGFFMTPYNTQRWKRMSETEPGMGSLAVSFLQMIPNRKKLNADAAYMQSMSAATREQKQSALNELFAQAKKAYYEWIIIERKKLVLAENEKILEFMINNAEIRYRNGLEKINAYYKAKAALGNTRNMSLMLDNEASQKRILLNTLMYRDKNTSFSVDTTILSRDPVSYVIDSSRIAAARSDIRAIDKEIQTYGLRQEAERQNLKPQFGIRYEHMVGFGGQPQQFTLMGMVRLPFVSWASRMTRATIDSYKWRSEALVFQKQLMINEASGMATGMYQEILSKKKQLKLFEQAIIPALKNNYKTILLAYEQNTEELFMLFDAWETLNMTQNEYLGQLQQVLTLQAELERILEIKN